MTDNHQSAPAVRVSQGDLHAARDAISGRTDADRARERADFERALTGFVHARPRTDGWSGINWRTPVEPPRPARTSAPPAAADVGDIFTAAVLLILERRLFVELERQAAQIGTPIAELARTACRLKDSEVFGLNAWAYRHVSSRTHRFLIRMTREDANRLKRQAANVHCPRSALMRAAIDAHIRSQPNLPTI